MRTNAGSYSAMAPATPMPTKARWSSSREPACDQPATDAAPSRLPPLMTHRAPERSSARPTGSDARPVTAMASVSAPDTCAVEASKAARIGTTITAKQ